MNLPDLSSIHALIGLVVGWAGSIEARLRSQNNAISDKLDREDVKDLVKPVEVKVDMIKEGVDKLSDKIDMLIREKK